MNRFPSSTHKYTQVMSSTDKHTGKTFSSSIRRHCRIFFPLLSVVVFAYLIVLLFTFVDVCNSPRFYVGSAGSLNSLTVSNTQLTAEFNISVSVYNPTDSSRVYFHDVSAEIFYRGEGLILTKSSLPSFTTTTTHRKSTSVIQMTLYVNKPFEFGGAASSISQNRKDGMVEFGLIVSGLYKYKNNMYDSGWKSLKVVCNPLKFAVSPNEYNINTTNPGILLEGLQCSRTY